MSSQQWKGKKLRWDEDFVLWIALIILWLASFLTLLAWISTAVLLRQFCFFCIAFSHSDCFLTPIICSLPLCWLRLEIFSTTAFTVQLQVCRGCERRKKQKQKKAFVWICWKALCHMKSIMLSCNWVGGLIAPLCECVWPYAASLTNNYLRRYECIITSTFRTSAEFNSVDWVRSESEGGLHQDWTITAQTIIICLFHSM